MNPAYEKLAELLMENFTLAQKQPSGVWLRIPDNISGASRRSSTDFHPCLVFSIHTRQHGFIELWVRSTSIDGTLPRYILHDAHLHSNSSVCPLNRRAVLDVKSVKRIPKRVLERYAPQCVENDQTWLRLFERCCLSLHNKTYSSVI